MTPMAGPVAYMPPKVVAASVGKMLMRMWATNITHTSGLNQRRSAGTPDLGAVKRSARKTITSMAISVTSGIMWRN